MILDSTKIEDIYDIKTSPGGNISVDQKTRLKNLLPAPDPNAPTPTNADGTPKLKVTVTPKRWSAGGFQANTQFQDKMKILSIIGAGSLVFSSTYAIVHAEEYNAEFDVIMQKRQQVLNQNNLDQLGADKAEFIEAVRQYLAHFIGDPTVFNILLYKKQIEALLPPQ
jgi:hypothetical protein